ncbi:MAG TPA: sigma 54-interacting transcriptional regulator [Gammaproteobacteria bacterium]|nr:sigma 54-interacting transcriptional regulator [Gammaproteobacteria bacterium]
MSDVAELEIDAILAISHDNVLLADAAGRVLKASPSCLRVYGVAPEDLVGRTVHELEERRVFSPSVTIPVLRDHEQHTVLQTTLTGRRVIATGIPVFDHSGELCRVVSTSYDLSDIEVLHREYEQLSARLLRRLSKGRGMEKETATRTLHGLVFRSEAMRGVCELVQRIADTDVAVLLLGESGVGKTALAELLHRESRRADGPFIELNCGAIPDTLFESEVFGHEPGAFTGARREGKPGMVERADGGTLFLDEVGDLSPAAQSKLLKVLQDRRVARVGATRDRVVDFRLVASTNRNLPEMIERGEFRLDLYYRLNTFPVRVPALRERRADIPVLLGHCLGRLEREHRERRSFSLGAERRLMRYDWPGNVRELESVVERLYFTAEGAVIDDLRDAIDALSRSAGPSPGFGEPSPRVNGSLRAAIAELERHLLERARAECRSTHEMARWLGISQASVVRRLRRHGLGPPGKRQ